MAFAIPLTRDKVALVDDADAGAVLRYSWRVGGNGFKYAIRGGHAGEPATVYMHRQIINPPRGLRVDHFDGDGLNNQRSNLRAISQSANIARAASVSNKHGFRGIIEWSGRYHGRVILHGKIYVTPSFGDAADAAAARELLVLELYGEHVILNAPVRDAA